MNMTDIQQFASNPHCAYVHGQNMKLVQKRSNAERARNIYKSLGLKVAINYLKQRGFSAEAVVEILLRPNAITLKGAV